MCMRGKDLQLGFRTDPVLLRHIKSVVYGIAHSAQAAWAHRICTATKREEQHHIHANTRQKQRNTIFGTTDNG